MYVATIDALVNINPLAAIVNNNYFFNLFTEYWIYYCAERITRRLLVQHIER